MPKPPRPPTRRRDPRRHSDVQPRKTERPAEKMEMTATEAAAMWMDFFIQFLDHMIDGDNAPVKNLGAIEQARQLADRALQEVEDRWPGVRL